MTTPGTVIFDLDGVVYRGEHAIDGAGNAMHTLSDAGWKLLFATNNASKTRETVADKITSRTGFSADPHDVVTSAMAAAWFMKGRYATTYVVGVKGLRWEMQNAGIEVVETSEAESVVVGVDFELSYAHIAMASEAIRNGAAFIATNTDATFPTADGRLAPGAGSIVAAIATASGRSPIICGKPHPTMGNLVAELVVGEQIWMVGDRVETDIELAKNHGWLSILPLTGVTTTVDGIPADQLPDHVVSSIADVPRIVMGPHTATKMSL